METLWFTILAGMLAFYVILDGFDLGTGVLHLWLAKNDGERRVLLQSIGPVWDGNEVFLVAAGGLLVVAFPLLYAVSFSGFYLPLMMVLWLLIARAVGLELRSHFDSPVWKQLCDVGFALSSALLCVFFGVALGNVVRGVPLDENFHFFQALWADSSRAGRQTGILDAYTVLVGVTALVLLAQHGALWIRLRTEGELRARAVAFASRVWWGAAVLTLGVTAASFAVQSQIAHNLGTRLWGWVFPLLAVGGLTGVKVLGRRAGDRAPFVASAVFLGGLMASAAFGVYPMVLPSVIEGTSLHAQQAAASPYVLRTALAWFVPGLLLTAVYFTVVYRKMGGKVALGGDSAH